MSLPYLSHELQRIINPTVKTAPFTAGEQLHQFLEDEYEEKWDEETEEAENDVAGAIYGSQSKQMTLAMSFRDYT